MNWRETIESYIQEGRTVSGGKGDKTLQQGEQSQFAFNNLLKRSFAQQFGAQSDIFNFLNSRLEAQIESPQGFRPETLAALKSGAIQDTATQYQNALKAQQAQQAARGGTGLPSGVAEQISGQLGGQAAGTLASELTGIQQQNEQVRQQNYWSAVQGLQGNAAMLNPLGYAGEYSGGQGTLAGLGSAYKQSQQSQLLGALGGLAGGVAGAVGSYYGAGKKGGGP